MAKPYIRKGKLALITDKNSRHYGRIGFNYLIEYNAKKNVCNYSISLIPNNKKIKLRDDLHNPKRFISFKDLENLTAFLVHENQIADF
jgi:hypothetical protein